MILIGWDRSRDLNPGLWLVEMYQFIRLLFQVALEAFGKRFDLELQRNLNLVPEQGKLNVFFADRGKEDIHYEPGDNEVKIVNKVKYSYSR